MRAVIKLIPHTHILGNVKEMTVISCLCLIRNRYSWEKRTLSPMGVEEGAFARCPNPMMIRMMKFIYNFQTCQWININNSSLRKSLITLIWCFNGEYNTIVYYIHIGDPHKTNTI